VGYQYAGRETAALDGLTMRLRRGELTALVGESGGGKSTAAAVLMRFLAPQTGQVMVGGADLAGISVAAWREQTAWVAQRPHLFNATLAENLRIAREDAADDRLWQALEDARLADFARALPRGLATPLGENGARLSSGQAQRLALARAFLRQAPLLVMDEPTAHLDAGEADLIAAVLRRLCQGRTVLMIAHRLETVVQADQIVVLRGGRAVEWGRYEELLSAGGEFSRLAARTGGAI
jgi:ABC-type multidrug transport system fused ATPase/permease subunit